MESKQIELENRIEYQNEHGQPHRLDGPAIEYSNGTKVWCINGKPHREDGPAREWIGGKAYYLNGAHYLEEEWKEEMVKLKLNRIKDL